MHERRHEHGHAAAHQEHAAATHAAGAVGKTTLTQGLPPVPGAASPHDPFMALLTKIQAAVHAGHAKQALHLMSTVGPTEQAQVAVELGPDARHKFAQDMPTSIGDARATSVSSEILFQNTPDAERSTLELLFEARFRLTIGTHPIPKHGRTFDALGLRRLWTVFGALPAGQVAHNWAVTKLDRYHDTKDKDPNHAHGEFHGPKDKAGEIDLSYRDSIIVDGGTTDHDREGDPLHGVNRFDEVARHEIGHAVDRELGWPSFSTLSLTREAGEWKNYWNPALYQQAAEEMVAGSKGPIHQLPPGQRQQVIAAMVQSMEHSETLHFRNVIDDLPNSDDLRTDAVYHVMTKGLASHNPWLSTKAIAGRHYHQAYKGTDAKGAGATWVSYSEQAYKNHRVSEYQFRAIQEWFAEAYAAFYTPVPDDEPKGKLLQDKLPHTHAWFKAHVDDKHALKKRSKAAHKKDHPPKKP